MIQSFTIEGQLPSLNDYIRSERAGKYAAASMKHTWQRAILVYIKKAKLRKMETPVVIHYMHYVKDRRRDRDNIAAIAHKITQDALVEAGILKSDGWDYVIGFTDDWAIDRKHPRIVVTISEENGAP